MLIAYWMLIKFANSVPFFVPLLGTQLLNRSYSLFAEVLFYC